MRHPIETLWREVGLPEYFLGNDGSNTKLYALYDAILARSSERTEEAVKAERERCAKIAEPKGPRPCDCEYGACYCRNAGDAAAVASWDADMAVARAIRAPVSGSTEAANG